jgi:hypothetical protein
MTKRPHLRASIPRKHSSVITSAKCDNEKTSESLSKFPYYDEISSNALRHSSSPQQGSIARLSRKPFPLNAEKNLRVRRRFGTTRAHYQGVSKWAPSKSRTAISLPELQMVWTEGRLNEPAEAEIDRTWLKTASPLTLRWLPDSSIARTAVLRVTARPDSSQWHMTLIRTLLARMRLNCVSTQPQFPGGIYGSAIERDRL